MIRRLAPELFRRHIRRRTHDDAIGCSRGVGVFTAFGKAKVHDLHQSASGAHQIRRLDVPMDHPRLVGGFQSGGGVPDRLRRLSPT